MLFYMTTILDPMTLTRDPISVWFDQGARRLLERAYASRETWCGVYLSQPTIRQRAAAAAELGILNLAERDRWGETRWVRAYKRSVYWHLGQYGRAAHVDFSAPREAPGRPYAAALQWQTGGLVRLSGWPTRKWAIRVRLHDGGREAFEAGQRAPNRWADTDRASSLLDHDWPQS